MDKRSGLELWNVTVGMYQAASGHFPMVGTLYRLLVNPLTNTVQLMRGATSLWVRPFDDSHFASAFLFFEDSAEFAPVPVEFVSSENGVFVGRFESSLNAIIPTSVFPTTSVPFFPTSVNRLLPPSHDADPVDWTYTVKRSLTDIDECDPRVMYLIETANTPHPETTIVPSTVDTPQPPHASSGFYLAFALFCVCILFAAVILFLVLSRRFTPSVPAFPFELTETQLGTGSFGTVVFEGRFNGRKVAIKRVVREFFTLAQHEIDIFGLTEEYPNLVRYYTSFADEHFIYIALTFCPETLEQHLDTLA